MASTPAPDHDPAPVPGRARHLTVLPGAAARTRRATRSRGSARRPAHCPAPGHPGPRPEAPAGTRPGPGGQASPESRGSVMPRRPAGSRPEPRVASDGGVRPESRGSVRRRAGAGSRAGGRPVSAGARPARGGGVRLTRRGRVVLVLAVAVLSLLALWVTAERGARAGDGAGKPGGAAQVVTVEHADTLWQIAVRHRPGVDPRITVQRIIRLNGLPGSIVQPGQQLRLPPR